MKMKIFTPLVLGIIFSAGIHGNAQNILTDGDFSTTTVIEPNYGWPPPDVWTTFQGGVDANANVVDGVCCYQILSSGNYTWEIQLDQAGFTLIQGHAYRLSFDVKADADRTFGVFLGENGGNWTDLLGYDRYTQNATTEWQTITLDFNATCVFDYHKLSFELGTISISMYFDNVSLTDLGPYESTIGILGSSMSGWDVDTDLSTADGVNYFINSLPLATGRVKFRQDNSWCINWGGTQFPTGTGYQYGPDIMVSNPGVYDVAFNKLTGAYSFTCTGGCSPFIGMAGSAVPPDYNSDPDVNMSTLDGIVYKLSYTFETGEAKFRQNDSWDVSWGGTTFPAGTALPGASGIPVKAGYYTVTFNIVTGDYDFAFPSIGVLGSALTGWDTDIDLQTTDGIVYTLSDYPFNDGEVKFRQDNDWSVNWGSYAFPSGWAYQDGPNIPVPSGTYNITFNRTTGEFSFVATSCPVAGIKCPDPVYTANTPGMCGAYVYYPPVTGAVNCGGSGIKIQQTGGLPGGSLFPLGVTTNTFELTNENGNTATCSFDVYVWDGEAPVITMLTDTIKPLWPPNHKMVPVYLNYSLSDNCGTANSEIWIYSNEPENGTGDGDTSPDWQILDNHNILLRAERSAKGTGREYYIGIFAWDNSWNYSFRQLTVAVPHDMSRLKEYLVVPDKTGTTDLTEPMTVAVWPNPSRENFNLRPVSSDGGLLEMTLSDVTGKQLSKQSVGSGQTISFGDGLAPGIYVVQVRQGEHTKTLKLLKQ